MASIINKNLELMIGREEDKGQMVELLYNESIGGNARSVGDRPCIAANFFYNPNTGEIKHFGNIQDVPKEIKRYSEGTLRLAIDTFRTWKFKVVNIYLRENPSQEAKQILKDSAKMYNKLYGY